MSTPESPLTEPNITAPKPLIMEWEDGQQAEAYAVQGDEIEWGTNGIPNPVEDPDKEIVITTATEDGKGSKSYLIHGGKILDMAASKEAGEEVAVDISSMEHGLGNVVIGKDWDGLSDFGISTKVLGVMVRRPQDQLNVEATGTDRVILQSGEYWFKREGEQRAQQVGGTALSGTVEVSVKSTTDAEPEPTAEPDTEVTVKTAGEQKAKDGSTMTTTGEQKSKADPKAGAGEPKVKADSERDPKATAGQSEPDVKSGAKEPDTDKTGPDQKTNKRVDRDAMLALGEISRDRPSPQLLEKFSNTPVKALAMLSKGMFHTYHDEKLTEAERDQRLDKFLSLIVELDQEVFPVDSDEGDKKAPWGYIPDGFTASSYIGPKPGKKVEVIVDTYNTLSQHKKLFAEIYAGKTRSDFEGDKNGQNFAYQEHLVRQVAQSVAGIESGEPPIGDNSEIALSEANPALDRQKAQRAQLILQALGVQSRGASYLHVDSQRLATEGDNARGRNANAVTVTVLNGPDKPRQLIALDITNLQIDADGNLVSGVFDFSKDKQTDGAWFVGEGDNRRKYTERPKTRGGQGGGPRQGSNRGRGPGRDNGRHGGSRKQQAGSDTSTASTAAS